MPVPVKSQRFWDEVPSYRFSFPSQLSQEGIGVGTLTQKTISLHHLQYLQECRDEVSTYQFLSPSQLSREGLWVGTPIQTAALLRYLRYSQGCGGEAPTCKISIPLPIDTGGVRGRHTTIHTKKRHPND